MAVFDLIGVLNGAQPTAPAPEVQMVVYQGQTVVMAASPRPLMRLPQSRRDHLIEVAARLRLQEVCMTLGTFLPAQQGNALSRQDAAAFLAANQPELADLMIRFGAQVQVQVTVSWAEDGVLAQFRQSSELAPIFGRGTVQPQELAAAVGRLAQRLSADIAAELAGVTTDIVTLPVAPGILWNGAVLVSRSNLGTLDQAVEAIDAIWSDGLTIRQIGPAPISSFASVQLEPVSRRQIEQALDRFDLKTGWTSADLAQARRRALMSLEPDAHGADREATRAQARIAASAARLAAAGFAQGAGLILCHLWSEGQKTPETLPDRAVA